MGYVSREFFFPKLTAVQKTAPGKITNYQKTQLQLGNKIGEVQDALIINYKVTHLRLATYFLCFIATINQDGS
jgi:hypothetical protein